MRSGRNLLYLSLLFALLASLNSVAAVSYPTSIRSGGFLNGHIVTIEYTANFTCSPSLMAIYGNTSDVANASKSTDCTAKTPGNLYSTLPVWEIYPSFASISTYGINQSTLTVKDRYPVFNGTEIYTDCGTVGTAAACHWVPEYTYGLNSTRVEQDYGIFNGISGQPKGVFPFPDYDYILLDNYSGESTPWYVVLVRVYDPNIFPNATTGKCKQVAPSNLSNPIGNCLTSFAALQRAYQTRDSYISILNKNNKLWIIQGSPMTQVQIATAPNVTGISGLLYPNTNMYLFFRVNNSNFYSSDGLNESTIASNVSQSYNYILLLGVIALIIVLFALYRFVLKRKAGKKARKKSARQR